MKTRDGATSTFYTDDPQRLRREAVARLVEATNAVGGNYHEAMEVDGNRFYTRCAHVAKGRMKEVLAAIEGSPVLAGGAASAGRKVIHNRRKNWSFLNPPRRQTVSFMTMAEVADPKKILKLPIGKTFAAAGIKDQLRVLIYDGLQYVGWLGVFETSFGAFDEAQRAAADDALDDLRGAVMTARALEEEVLCEEAVAIFTAEGKLLFASQNARDMSPQMRDRLGRHVVQTDRGGEQPMTIIDGYACKVTRLDGSDGVRYVTSVRHASPVAVRFEDVLTERQESIARLIVTGATAEDVAARLEVSRETVKYHLRRIYKRLEIDTRAELATIAARS